MEWERATEQLFERIVMKMPEGFRPSVKPMIIEAAERRMNELKNKVFQQSNKIEMLKNDALAVAKHTKLVMDAQFKE